MNEIVATRNTIEVLNATENANRRCYFSLIFGFLAIVITVPLIEYSCLYDFPTGPTLGIIFLVFLVFVRSL